MATAVKESYEGTKTLLKGLCILTQAVASKETLSQGKSEHFIENVLHENLISLRTWLTDSNLSKFEPDMLYLTQTLEAIGSSPTSNVRDLFSRTSVMMLDHLTSQLNSVLSMEWSSKKVMEELNQENTESENKCPTLSVQQEKQISTCIQFVVVLGLCPYLPQGVGIPVSQRLGPGQILLASAHDMVTQLSEVSRIEHLMPILKLFMKMLNCSLLHNIVLTAFLSDVFVLLIQIRHSAKIILQDLKSTSSVDGFTVVGKEKDCSGKIGMGKIIHQQGPKLPSEIVVSEFVLNDGHELMNAEILERTVQDCNVDLDRTIRMSSVPPVLKEVLYLLGFAKSVQGVKTVPWFRRAVAGILRDLTMDTSGIQHLFASFLGDLTSYDTKDWHKCKAVARIISHCPVNVKNIDHFYSSVCQQLLELIHPRRSSIPFAITKSVGATVLELNNLQSDLMHRFCFTQLLAPLVDCSVNSALVSSKHPDSVVVSETSLTTCISHCHRLFVLGQEMPSPLCTKLKSVIGILFTIFVHIRESASHLKCLVQDLLTGYLSNADTQDGVACLMELLLSPSKTGGCHPPIYPSFTVASASEGGVEVVVARDTQMNIESWTFTADTIVDLLTCTKSDALNSDLFLALLQRLTNVVSEETNLSSDILLPARVVSPEVKEARLTELREKVALVSLISSIGEKFGSTIIQSTSQILLFTKVTLDRCVRFCALSDELSTQEFEWETVIMALGLLSAVLGIGETFTDEDKGVLDSITPLLTSLSQSDAVESHIQDMAIDLMVAVATRGLVSVNLSGQRKSSSKMETVKEEVTDKTTQESTSKPLIEVLSSCSSSEGKSISKEAETLASSEQITSNQGSEEGNSMSKWSRALEEVNDPQIPIRGHGLIQLARMVEDREGNAMTQSDFLLKVFLDNLSHSDSYIYLASINGLVALSDLCPDDAIPSLTSEFLSKCRDDQCSWETTLKVGEAVVKATRRLGAMAPKYKDVLLSTILFGVRHENGLVRASCLSGLAEVCLLLRFSVSAVIQEVLMCCRLVLTSDPDPDPRRAAALTLASLLQGLGKDTVTTLGEVLSELYRPLKNAVNIDPDDKVKVHAQLALQELDEIMKGFIFPTQDLKKSIKILGYQY